MTEDNNSFLKHVNSSGFAFQMRIEEEIRNAPNRWQIAGREHRWQDENGQSGYIDLIVDIDVSFAALRVLIECKKRKESNWVFLKAKSSEHKDKSSLLWSKKYKPISQLQFPSDFLAWDVVSVSPTSYMSAFCTMQGQSDNTRTLLERTASELTHAAECLAKEELAFSTVRDPSYPNIYMPIIVTNAKLMVCSFAPYNVSISTGELLLDDTTFEDVPYIRFQKGLETSVLGTNVQLGRRDLELSELNAEKERTVFVVNSEHLLDFLKSCNLLQNGNQTRFPWNTLDEIYYSLVIK